MVEVAASDIVVVDASLATMWVLSEQYSALALALAADWARTGIQAVAPCLLPTEVASAIYKRVRRGEMLLEQALEAMDIVLGFGVRLDEEPDLHRQAIALSHRLNLPAPYDAHYLALAALRKCEAWTGDERLYNTVREQIPWLRWIGTYSSLTGQSSAIST